MYVHRVASSKLVAVPKQYSTCKCCPVWALQLHCSIYTPPDNLLDSTARANAVLSGHCNHICTCCPVCALQLHLHVLPCLGTAITFARAALSGHCNYIAALSGHCNYICTCCPVWALQSHLHVLPCLRAATTLYYTPSDSSIGTLNLVHDIIISTLHSLERVCVWLNYINIHVRM